MRTDNKIGYLGVSPSKSQHTYAATYPGPGYTLLCASPSGSRAYRCYPSRGVEKQRHPTPFKRLLLFLLVLLAQGPSLAAQNWQSLNSYGGPGGERSVHLATNEMGENWLLGLFPQTTQIAGQTLTSRGEDDILLFKTDAAGTPIWATRAGSDDKDQANGIALDGNGNAFIAGLYWDNADFQQISISPSQGSSSAAYLAKYNPDGTVLWVLGIEGQGKKDIEDIRTDAAGNVYLCGTFEGNLFLAGQTLVSTANESAFLLKYDNDGNLIFAKTVGLTGQVNGMALGIHESGNLVLGGHYKGSIAFAGDTIFTNTDDFDLFLLQYDEMGDPQWLKKIGGVFETRFRDLDVADGNTYVTGHYNGLLNFDNIQLANNGLDDDLFLAAVDLGGTVSWAKSLGGPNYEEVASLRVQNGQVYIAGVFDENTSFETFSLVATDNAYDGFLATFETNGAINSLEAIGGIGFEFPSSIALAENGKIALAGYFQTDLGIDNLSISTDGNYDIFLLKGLIEPTAIHSIPNKNNYDLYPNPTQGDLFIKGLTDKTPFIPIKITDQAGRVVLEKTINPKNPRLHLGHLPAGHYWFSTYENLESPNIPQTKPLIILH